MIDPKPAEPVGADPILRLALRIIAVAGRLVPEVDRRGWRAEWHAEILSRARRLGAEGRLGMGARLGLAGRALGSTVDAWEVATHGFRLRNLIQDLRYAFRALLKRPAYSVTAVVTLALGIGATTALFSVVRGVLLRPFPYEQPERLVQLMGQRMGEEPGSGNVSYPNLDDIERRATNLAGVAGLASWRPALTGDEPEVLPGATVSSDYFEVLGVRPAAGRFFSRREEGEGREQVVVISHGLWTRRFAADPAVVGNTISVNNEPAVVLGVTPAEFEGPRLISFDGRQPEIWRTPWFEAADWFRSGRSWKGVARLAEGATLGGAATELETIMAALGDAYPEENRGRTVIPQPLRDSVVGSSRSALVLLLGAVALVLLVACVNVGNLLLGRMLERYDELLLRTALGASRGRMLTHLMAESLGIALVGGLLGIGLAFVGVGALVAAAGPWLPRPDAVVVDAGVLAFASALTIGTGLLFGVAPAARILHAAGAVASAGVRGGGALGRRATRLRRVLVVGQIATTVVLVIGAGLLVASLRNLLGVELGVQRRGVVTIDLHGSALWDMEPEEATVEYRTLLDRIAALPGIERAGAIDVVPLSDNHSCDGFRRLDRPPPGPGEGRCVEVRSATPGALEALGVPLIDGRHLEWTDAHDAPGSLVLSRAAAEMFWPGEDAVGHTVLVHADTFTVVGVVADILHFGPAERATPMAILSAAQEPWNGIARGMSIVASGAPAVEAMGPELRRAVQEQNARLAIERIRPMGALLANVVGGPRFRASLLLLFAGAAMLLALVGIAGVMAQAVTRRKRELGLRIAIGAAPRQATRAVLAEGASLTGIGLSLGLVASIGLTRLLQGFVFGVSPLDPAILAGGAALVCVLGLAACWIPARAAARIDPMRSLRVD